MRQLFIFLLFSLCFGEFLETDSILGNSHSIQFNDTTKFTVKPLSTNPWRAAVWDSADNRLKSYPMDSITSDSVRAAWKADTSGTARWSHRPVAGAASAADTGLLARRGSDSTFRVLTRAQLRTAVDSVRASDTSRGADRLDGYHKSYYDTVGNGGMFCDTPYIPKAVKSGSTKSYTKSILRERGNYIEITGYDTAFAALNAPDDYYQGMAVDTNGNVLAISTNSGDLYVQTGGSGSFVAQGVTGRSYYHLVVDEATNNLYTAVYADGVYRRLAAGGDFSSYGMSGSSCQYGITLTASRDLFVANGNTIRKQAGLTGSFDSITALSPSINVTGLFSIDDTVFVFTNNSGVYRLPPGATALVNDGQLTRYYQDAFSDDAGNVYVTVGTGGPTDAGIYKRPIGGAYFDLMFASALSWRAGAYYNGNLYACNYASNGDIYTSQANYSQLFHRFNVNGTMTVTGNIQIPFKRGDGYKSLVIDTNGTIDTVGTHLGSIHNHDDTITVSVPSGTGYTKLGIFPKMGNCKGVTGDTANDQIILITNGYYDCTARVTCYVGTAGVNIRPVLFLNGTEQDQTHDETNFPNANAKQRIIATGIIKVENAPDTLSLMVRHDNGGSVNINCTYGNMKAIFEGQL